MLSWAINKSSLFIIIQVKARSGQKYDDAFTLQKVKPGDLFNFNFVAGLVPVFNEMLIKVKVSKIHIDYTDFLH